jgi:hypothetical protein
VKLRILVPLALATTLVLVPTTASAKGPGSIEVIGPGLNEPIRVDRVGNTSSPGGQLVQAAGFFQSFAPFATGARAAAMATSPPGGARGSRYVVTYFLSSDREERVRQEVYPFAEGGPLVYTPAGQEVYGVASPTGGWRRVDPLLIDLLVSLGVPTPAERKGWSTVRDDENELSISYPPSWQPAKSTVAPLLIDPKIPLALGTYDFPTEGCGAVPGPALEALGPEDAFIAVYVGHTALGDTNFERPARFGPDLPWWDGPIKCTGNVRGTVRDLHFQVGERRLSVMIAFGPEASKRRQGQTYRILDTLTVEPGGSDEPAPEVGMRPRSHRATGVRTVRGL